MQRRLLRRAGEGKGTRGAHGDEIIESGVPGVSMWPELEDGAPYYLTIKPVELMILINDDASRPEEAVSVAVAQLSCFPDEEGRWAISRIKHLKT